MNAMTIAETQPFLEAISPHGSGSREVLAGFREVSEDVGFCIRQTKHYARCLRNARHARKYRRAHYWFNQLPRSLRKALR
jgi:hypothetical protein